MWIALLGLAAVFAALAFLRVGGARRVWLMRYWPTALLAAAGLIFLLRGAPQIAILFAAAAALAWWIMNQRQPAPTALNLDEAEARALLGVGPEATSAEIRAAYRAKMATAHPDRGGTHERAARLTAARDRLLKR